MSSDAKLRSTKQASPLFAARLTPHRALGKRGRHLVIGLMALVIAVPALVFMHLGAWPVLAFLAIDLVAVALALAWSARDGKRFEQITLWTDTLEVLQVNARGLVRRFEFHPLQVRLLVERDFDERTTAMKLRHGEGDALEIGAFLNAEDKASFAKVFGTALRKART